MGMFDFLFNKEKAQERQLENLRKKLCNIWVQSPDRYMAAEQLRDIGTPEAIGVLYERFKVQVKNSTYDNQEKLDLVDMLVYKGSDAIEPAKDFVRREQTAINYPMRVLDELLTSAQMAEFIVELLGAMDIDYERDPEKKEQLVLRAQEYTDFDEINAQVARFAADDNETIRFLAVNHTVARGDHEYVHEAMRHNLRFEDSGRILNVVCEYLVNKEVGALPEDADEETRADLTERLPSIYYLTEEGYVRRK